MNSRIKPVFLAALLLLSAPLALAQATRTWVSVVGDDANPCSRTAPCKTFAGAISKTAVNGVISVLDPGGFGAVTITKSITIDGSGTQASILASSTNGINVTNTGATPVAVKLRDINIDGVDAGLVGISINSANTSVVVENCRISGFRAGAATGIRASQATNLVVKDSTISDSNVGIDLSPASGVAWATITNTLIHDTSLQGILISGAGYPYGSISRSTITQNNGYGVFVTAPNAVMNIIDNTISLNGSYGINISAAGARARISGNTLVNNNYALGITSGATVESDSTNRIGGLSPAYPNGVFTNY